MTPRAPTPRITLTLPALPARRGLNEAAPLPARPGRRVDIEFAWHQAEHTDWPLVVFLHEGLGSIALWRDFPATLCAAAGVRGLVYSRAGYGGSTPRPADERLPLDYLHIEANQVLPALLAALGLAQERPWLLGHSDGGSIALIRAASAPDSIAGLIVMAPHLRVEPERLPALEVARDAWFNGNLRSALGRYHDDPASAFFGWNDTWLSTEFRDWNIEPLLAAIRCPVLAIQGEDDQYGSLFHITDIARHVPQTELLALPGCGHTPYREQPERVQAAMLAFLDRHRSDAGGALSAPA